MAVLNFKGFEGNEFTTTGGDGFSFGTGTTTHSTTTVRSGVYACRIQCTTTQTGYTNITNIEADGTIANSYFSVATMYHSFWFLYVTKPASTSEEIFASNTSVGGRKASVRIDSNGKLSVWDNTGTVQLGSTGTTVLNSDTWYNIQIKVGTGASGAYELKINGVSELSGTGDLGTNNNAISYYGKVVDRNSNTVEFFYDDIVVSDTDFVDYTAKIVKLAPNANGSTMTWTAGTGASNYTTVDEIPEDSTDYVQSPASGAPNAALFALQSMSDVGATASSILSFKGHTAVRENTSVTSASLIRIRSSSTNSDSSTDNIGTTVETKERLLNTDPATGSAWTTSGIDAVEVGAVENNNVAVRCTQVFGLVLYVPSVAGTVIKDVISMGLLFPR